MNQLRKYYNDLLAAKPEELSLSVDNCHADGLFSLVFNGTEFGKLTRAFIATKKIKPFDVQLHTHTYNLTITAVQGVITHHVADIGVNKKTLMPYYEYRSPLNGGNGLSFSGHKGVDLNSYYLPPTSIVGLSYNDYHTVSCDKNSIWIVEEHGFTLDSSRVLGSPFTTDNLYPKPTMYQINDRAQTLKNAIKKHLNAHDLVTEDPTQ